MRRNKRNAGRKRGSGIRFQGLSSDARKLNISASYLWLCLSGRRNGARIVNAYLNLKKQQAIQFLTESTPDRGRAVAGLTRTNHL
jgi:hypothetical protein